ncbi:hypothetical protein GGP99_003433 [Salinibacter ruber]|jgi:hypothetical protein|uniref:Uncharacterized protein n=1 Tax=Salinibacter ruber TaxID=146919 RepID=A0AAW5PCB4_9BACT|nr:hypothetical protein [Salinibacter ruber]MCS4223692.1 hypothetical protein [Salinibacter ruber]
MSNGKADRTDQRSSKQPSSGLLDSGLLTWNSCGQSSYGVGAAAAAGGAVGVALFDKVILVGAVAGLGALAHFLSGWVASDW